MALRTVVSTENRRGFATTADSSRRLRGCVSFTADAVTWVAYNRSFVRVLTSRAPQTLWRLRVGVQMLDDFFDISDVRVNPRLRDLASSSCTPGE